jgi:hypothetical protein
LVDPDIYADIKNVTEKTIAYLNNGIKYGRNKWSFRINVIRTTDSNEVIRACKYKFKFKFFDHSLSNLNISMQ